MDRVRHTSWVWGGLRSIDRLWLLQGAAAARVGRGKQHSNRNRKTGYSLSSMFTFLSLDYSAMSEQATLSATAELKTKQYVQREAESVSSHTSSENFLLWKHVTSWFDNKTYPFEHWLSNQSVTPGWYPFLFSLNCRPIYGRDVNKLWATDHPIVKIYKSVEKKWGRWVHVHHHLQECRHLPTPWLQSFMNSIMYKTIFSKSKLFFKPT